MEATNPPTWDKELAENLAIAMLWEVKLEVSLNIDLKVSFLNKLNREDAIIGETIRQQWLAKGKHLTPIVNDFAIWIAGRAIEMWPLHILPEQRTNLALAYYSYFIAQLQYDAIKEGEADFIEQHQLSASILRLGNIFEALSKQSEEWVDAELSLRVPMQEELFNDPEDLQTP